MIAICFTSDESEKVFSCKPDSRSCRHRGTSRGSRANVQEEDEWKGKIHWMSGRIFVKCQYIWEEHRFKFSIYEKLLMKNKMLDFQSLLLLKNNKTTERKQDYSKHFFRICIVFFTHLAGKTCSRSKPSVLRISEKLCEKKYMKQCSGYNWIKHKSVHSIHTTRIGDKNKT